MKKFIAIAALGVLTLTSCKKDYTCTCTASSGGISVSSSVVASSGLSPLEAAALAAQQQMNSIPATDVKFCGVDDPTCESCQ